LKAVADLHWLAKGRAGSSGWGMPRSG